VSTRERSIATFLDGAALERCGGDEAVSRPTRRAVRSRSVAFQGAWRTGGLLLAGARDRIERAVRQLGIMAAAGLLALVHHMERLGDDHANARRIAERLVQSQHVRLAATVQANIAVFSLSPDAPDAATVVARARARGVLIFPSGVRTIRPVTHLDASREQCDRAAQIPVEVIGGSCDQFAPLRSQGGKDVSDQRPFAFDAVLARCVSFEMSNDALAAPPDAVSAGSGMSFTQGLLAGQ